MNPTFWQRQRAHNPIYPYSWQAGYKPTGALKQYDVDGYHTSRDIDLTRVSYLDILGHPDSPIRLHAPIPGMPVDEVAIWAINDIEITQGSDRVERSVTYCFGFGYGSPRSKRKYFLIRIHDGRLYTDVDASLITHDGQRKLSAGEIVWRGQR